MLLPWRERRAGSPVRPIRDDLVDDFRANQFDIANGLGEPAGRFAGGGVKVLQSGLVGIALVEVYGAPKT
jgi:hypothetical protein